MIEFQLDSGSGVATYVQLVQQVRQALQLGILEPGDQLPTAQQVVARLAINPNTVLKAYRDLEREGLVRARPGLGTFVVGSLPRTDPAAQARLFASMADWLRSARSAGLGPDDIEAIYRTTFRNASLRARRDAILETSALGKRYGRRWALWDCTLSIPEGKVVGLVGPNGAGKTTLLHLGVGLLAPTSGRSKCSVVVPGAGPAQLGRIGFVAQDTPTYAGLSVAKHLRMGAYLNPGWDDEVAQRRIERLGLDPRQRAGSLSGGQRAQLALTLAIAKRPELLFLDEPVASLDPLARREFLQVLMDVVAEHGVSVVLSSHLVADLERICDYLVVLVASQVQVSGEIGDVARVTPPHLRTTPEPERPSGGPGGHRGEPDRKAEHAPRAHRRPSPRPGVDGQAGHPGRPRPRLHEPGSGRRTDPRGPDWMSVR